MVSGVLRRGRDSGGLGVWNKQNIEGSDLILPSSPAPPAAQPLPFVFRLKTQEDLQEPRVSCSRTVFST